MNSEQIEEFKKVYAGISKNIKNKKWSCIIDSCNNASINSHLLQQNGILNTIAEENHVIEIKATDSFSWGEKKPPMEFKRISVGQALSLSLFCNNHDSSIFKKVETAPVDFSDIENQILLSYRAVCAEIRKKEMSKETFSRMLNSSLIHSYIPISDFELFIQGSKRGIADLNFYKKEFEDALELNRNEFEFVVYKYPLIKVYCSAAYSPFETEKTPFEGIPLNYIFIHIIPYNQELTIIIGYHKRYFKQYITDYINSWKDLSLQNLEKMLTNLFATKVENWGLSPKINRNISKSTISKFVEYFEQNSLNHLINQKVEFNLFENNNYGT